MEDRVPRAITVGVSDPTGTSGVQADLKTFAAFGVHGAAVVTGVMTRSASGSDGLSLLSPSEVADQIEMAANRSGADAIKVGAVANAEIARAVSAKIEELGLKNTVVDPSLIADESGVESDGANEGAVAYLKSSLFPVGDVAVVDISECKLITGLPIKNAMGMKAGAKLIRQMGPNWVVVSGSELDGEECTDYMFDGHEYMELPSERVDAPLARGSGAAYSAAITAGMAHGRSADEAIAIAKMYVTETLTTAYDLEGESESLRHLYAWWEAGGSRGYGA